MIRNFQELVSQIKTQVPIQELISEFISVKKSGKNYIAICPFHSDHHPSLQISPQKGIFKCFACGVGGDLITFYCSIKKIKWNEAIPELALKYGFKVEYGEEDKTENRIKNQLYELNRVALDFFKNNLLDPLNSEVLTYVKEIRQLTQDTINKYEIGYAPNKWDSLLTHLIKTKSYPTELIIASGLFIPKENHGHYDRFRNRVIFPIYNEINNIVGFGGRTLSNSPEEAKYINSPETLIFNKSQLLYGLNFAKEEIKKSDHVILTEGYLDVITAHQHGLLNTVATLGTALSINQIRLLTKHTTSKKVYLCLDSDRAGKRAVQSIFYLLKENPQNIPCDCKVITSLPKKDLDESLKAISKDDFKKLFENSQKLPYFIIDQLYIEHSCSDNELNKKEIFNQMIETVISIKDPFEYKELIKYLSHKVVLDEDLINLRIKEKFNQLHKKKRTYATATDTTIETHKMHSIERFQHAELELLALYVNSFPNSNKIKQELAKIEFIDEKNKLIKDFIDNQNDISPQEVIDKLIVEFNEYKNIMSQISNIGWRIETDSSSFLKNQEVILSEAKEWITWWINNKQKMKTYTSLLKDCKSKEAEEEILVKMMELVKNNTSINSNKE